VKGNLVTADDTIRAGVTMPSLASLQPAFPQWGEQSTTAGNASGIGDGAAICIMTTRDRAEREGWDVVGKWIGSTFVGER
jgi:acetyl-CoA acyltransferase 1